MDKSDLRETYCGVREALRADSVAEQSTAVSRRLGRMAVLRHAETVMAYLAFKNELDLSLLFDLLPRVSWVLPRIEGRRMVLHPYEPDRLVRHPFGMLEPRADAPVVDPQDLDVVLVPGVSFDRRGGRLGFGGGFYDRFLVRTSAIRVGICHDCCLVEKVPMDAHDERMDWVVTPTVAIHSAPLWRRQPGPHDQEPFAPTLPRDP
jgi:5-formyltetrahydrofolate cyclo-ligase